MKRIVVLIVCGLLGAGAVAFGAREGGSPPGARENYRTATLARGSIAAAVSATGTVNPTTTVIVGSQLSGQVVEILADYNSIVKSGQVLARLNRQQIEAKRDAAAADLAQARAAREVQDAQEGKIRADIARAGAASRDMEAQAARAAALLADAERTFERQSELQVRGISSEVALQNARTQRDAQAAAGRSAQAQIDSSRAQIAAFEAELRVLNAQKISSEATIAQKAAIVRQIEVDLGNAEIRSPVDGVVVQRNIELGATVAASFTAPTLFLVAQDLARLDIYANIDEADVGRVRQGQRVNFQVTAYPGRTFVGRVRQVRLGSQTVQNVVIYTAVIEVDNVAGDLMPGMTATLRILAEEKPDVLRVPNAALRWRPLAEAASTASTSPIEIDANPAGPFVTPGEGRRQGPPSAVLARLKTSLARAGVPLSEDQSRALDTVIAQRARQAENAAPGAEGAPTAGAARRGAGAGMMREIDAILTEEQRAKLAELRRQARPVPADGPDGTPGRVYVLSPDNEPIRTDIRLGPSDGAFTEVIGGPLEPGQRVVVGGGPATRPPGTGGFRLGF